MIKEHKRRSRLLGFTIKRESFGIEVLREHNVSALDKLEKSSVALNEVESLIRQTQASSLKASRGETPLDLFTIQNNQNFLTEQYVVCKERLTQQKRAQQTVSKVEAQLKEGSLYIRALEKVKEKTEKTVSCEREKNNNDRNIEDWLQSL